MTSFARLRAALAHPRLPLALAAIAIVLSLPAIGTGFVLDDYVLRAVSLGLGAAVGVPGTRFDLFTFFSDAPGERLRAIDAGWSPWWAGADLRLHFFRPLSSLSHWIDFQFFPDAPIPMHLENVAIYAALVLAAAAFFRRMIGPTPVAGLAALLYAIDAGHAQSAGMIAGRNTLLAPLFGVLALTAFDRARRGGLRANLPLSAALLAASLLAGESGLSTALYLLAYAICLDPDPAPARRARALIPHAIVLAAWIAAYKILGHGARGSSMYTDPGHDPVAFLRDAIVRAPIALVGEIGLPPASLFSALSVRATVGLAIFCAIFCAIFARCVWPILRADPVARFFALGMILSLLPISAIIPNDRVLFFVGLGAIGLIARFLAATLAGPTRAPRSHRALAWFLAVVHVPLALLLYPLEARSMASLAAVSREPLDAILLDPGVAQQTVVFVNAPAQFLISHVAAMRVKTPKPIPLRWRALAPGIYPLKLTRVDDRSLTVRVEGGILQPPGTWNVEGQDRDPPLNPSYGAQYFAQIVRRVDDPMRAGDTIALTGVTIEVREVTADGRPVEVRFSFDAPLESPALQWMKWEQGRYVPFAIPKIGETVTLAPASMLPG